MTQVSLGVSAELGNGTTLVLSLNCPVNVAYPKGFTVLVEESLLGTGVGFTKAKVKFPGDGVFLSLVTVLENFKQVQVTVPTPTALLAVLVAASANLKAPTDQAGFMVKLDQVLDLIPSDGPTFDLVRRLMETDTKFAKLAWVMFKGFMTELETSLNGVNYEAVAAELSAVAQQYQDRLPGSALEAETDEVPA